MMKVILDSKWSILNPDRNPLLRVIIRGLIYNHFCAGTTPGEVRGKVQAIKNSGYSGVILGFTREILAGEDEGTHESKSAHQQTKDQVIDSWLQANLETLALIGQGDYTNIKFTGAGPAISEAMLAGQPAPKQMVEAFDKICEVAKSRGVRVWIDAEMQVFQPMVDAWAVEMMRRHNRNGEALVYNTYQAYLKKTRSVMLEHMKLAKSEGWTLGIKLVRGAYIQNEIRDRIWDTKPETDANYNSIVKDVLTKNWHPFDKESFPDVEIFLAGHNKESIRRASQLVCELVQKGEDIKPVQYGQLQGMADDVSHELVQLKKAAEDCSGLSAKEAALRKKMAPQPYKCLAWGSVSDVMGFLMRRAVENASATERLKDGLTEMKAELRRRLNPFARS